MLPGGLGQAASVIDVEALDADACYRVVRGKDGRFDGVFYFGVSSTHIYCRPSCPANTAKQANLTYYRTAAAAQAEGFRACKRCRPDAAPGSPEWNVRSDSVGRSMRLIADGVVDRVGVAGLARQVGYSERQLNRQLVAELGVGPLALARSQRARTARILLETSTISMSDVAFAAGFNSIRQFNETIREVFDATPSQLRDRNAKRSESARERPVAAEAGSVVQFPPPGSTRVRLAYRQPMNVRGVLDFLGQRAVTGIEDYRDGVFYKALALPIGSGVAALRVADVPEGARSALGWVDCDVWLDDLRDLTAAVARCRRMLDLDSDPVAIDEYLAQDPLLHPLVVANPGSRMPGSTDPNEVAFRVVIGQQVSTAGARTVAGRLVKQYGRPLRTPVGAVTHSFPTPGDLVEADPADLAMPTSRKRAIKSLATALADESLVLSAGSDWAQIESEMLDLHGIGPWTVAAVRMRGLGDPDVFLSTDLGVQKALARAGVTGSPRELESYSQQWRPWRSYTTHHLWASLEAASGQNSTNRTTNRLAGHDLPQESR